MKKNKARLLSTVIAAIMIGSIFTGCSSESEVPAATQAPTTEATQTPAATVSQTPVTPSATETPATPEAQTSPNNYTISILTISHDGSIIANDHPNVLALQEHTGYNIKLEYVLNASYNEQMNTRLASGDLPGLVVLLNNTSPIVLAAKSGAFWDITDKYKEYPNLAQANTAVMNNISIDGRIYGIYRSRTIGRSGITYRADWLENLNLNVPETLNDLYNVLYAFTNNDPDKNGANDTYGMTWSKYPGSFQQIAIMHGVPNFWGVDEKGLMYPWFEADEYYEAMDFSKKLYDENLINRDFAALESSAWVDDFNMGKTGFHIDLAGQANRSAVAMKDNGLLTQAQVDDGSIVWVMGSVASNNGEKYSMATTGHAGYVAISKSGAKTEQDLHYHLDFMDKCNDVIGQNILNYGVEGIAYDLLPDGTIKTKTAADIPNGWDVTAGWNQFMMNVIDNLLLQAAMNPRQKRANELATENLPYCVHNPTLPLNSSTYTDKKSSLEQIIQDATINYIMGKIDREGFEKEKQRWYKEGGQDSLEEYQASYDAINK